MPGFAWTPPAVRNAKPLRHWIYYTSSPHRKKQKGRNINRLPIQLRLSPSPKDRLTLRRIALRRKPWICGEHGFHVLCDYSCQHSLFPTLHRPSRVRLQCRWECSPTPPAQKRWQPCLRYSALAPLNFRRHYPRIVSCYTLFEGWLPLSQPPICHRVMTSFNT